MTTKKAPETLPIDLMRALVALGITYPNVAELVGLDLNQVHHIFRKKENVKRGQPYDKEMVFTLVFAKYCRLQFGKMEIEGLQDCLAKWLNIDSVKHFYNGLVAAGNLLTKPGYTPAQKPYVGLLSAIFGVHHTESDPDWTMLHKEFCSMVVRNEIPMPTTLDNYREWLAKRYTDTFRNDLAPAWKEDTEQIIEDVLKELEAELPVGARVLRLRFGIGLERRKTYEVAEMLEMTIERIRQIETKALRMLRNPERVMRLRPLYLFPPTPVWIPPPTQNELATGIPQEVLDATLDEFEISVRLDRALKGGKIKTIHDLVKRTETDLLKLEEFGRKCLKELKMVLAELSAVHKCTIKLADEPLEAAPM